MDITELCEKLKIKKATVYDWVYHKRIPFTKIGNLLRFKEELIEKWLEENTYLPACLKIKNL